MTSPSMKVHYMSETPEWETPQDFFEKIQKEFRLKVDVCATPYNTKLTDFFSEEQDGLSQDWTGLKCWMNPPYGREIGKWVEKAATGGAKIVVALLPSRTDTRWWHDWIQDKAEVRFIKGRLKFGDSKNSAPFPSAVVIFRSN